MSRFPEFLFWFAMALTARAALDLIIGTVTRLIRRRRARKRRPSDLAKALAAAVAHEDAKLELMAQAIAEAAGHNWTATMMPGYRADFRRQAGAALEAHARYEANAVTAAR